MSVEAFVLDASITAAWLLPDEDSAAARGLYAKLRGRIVDAHAPELWLWECGNIIANSVKRRRMSPADALLTWSVLDTIRSCVELSVFDPAQVRGCLVLALEQGLSIYDAAYLWLASSLKLPLLTHDKRLKDAARRHAVPLPALEDLA